MTLNTPQNTPKWVFIQHRHLFPLATTGIESKPAFNYNRHLIQEIQYLIQILFEFDIHVHKKE